MNKIDLSLLKDAKKYSIEYIDAEGVVDNEFLKKFRNDNNMTQIRLANLLNVSKKTIEKWEQGKNPITGTSAVLLYLFQKNPELMKILYKEERNYSIEEIEYFPESEIEKTNEFELECDFSENNEFNCKSNNIGRVRKYEECTCF